MTDSKQLINPTKKYSGWSVIARFDEGAFGQLYRVRKGQETAALKAESNEVEGGSAIKMEMAVLLAVHKDGERPFVPFIFHAAKRSQFCYMIMTMLGKNLKDLKQWKPGTTSLSIGTSARLGIQALYGLKLIHEAGYIHRDIKPANFAIGRNEDIKRARSYYTTTNGKIRARNPRESVEFRGTLRYCSKNVHNEKEHGRIDDVWSWFYMLIEFSQELPWSVATSKEELEAIKKKVKDEDLVKKLPEEVQSIVPIISNVGFFDRPDYYKIAETLTNLCKKNGVTFVTPYDWEEHVEPNVGCEILRLRNCKVEYEDLTFFKLDPIPIVPPTQPHAIDQAKSKVHTVNMNPSAESVETKSTKMTSKSQTPGQAKSAVKTVEGVQGKSAVKTAEGVQAKSKVQSVQGKSAVKPVVQQPVQAKSKMQVDQPKSKAQPAQGKSVVKSVAQPVQAKSKAQPVQAKSMMQAVQTPPVKPSPAKPKTKTTK